MSRGIGRPGSGLTATSPSDRATTLPKALTGPTDRGNCRLADPSGRSAVKRRRGHGQVPRGTPRWATIETACTPSGHHELPSRSAPCGIGGGSAGSPPLSVESSATRASNAGGGAARVMAWRAAERGGWPAVERIGAARPPLATHPDGRDRIRRLAERPLPEPGGVAPLGQRRTARDEGSCDQSSSARRAHGGVRRDRGVRTSPFFEWPSSTGNDRSTEPCAGRPARRSTPTSNLSR